MKKEINYYVIGGQYAAINYGGAKTLEGAKRLATAHTEYWDNWQGWHKPYIVAALDCVNMTNLFGKQMLPKDSSVPRWAWNRKTNKWDFEERR